MNPSSVSAGTFASAVATDPSGRFVYVAGIDGRGNNLVLQFAVGANGSLAPLRFVYVVSFPEILQFTIGVDGTLAPMSPASVGVAVTANGITVDPSGRYVYLGLSAMAAVAQSVRCQYCIAVLDRCERQPPGLEPCSPSRR